MDIPYLKIKYPKPAKFSDPYCDFFDDPELDRIISLPFAEMTQQDLLYIFNLCLPAGTYQEMCCFVPRALNVVLEDVKGRGYLLENLLLWISLNHKELDADGWLQPLKHFIYELFMEITSSFKIVQFEGTVPHPSRGDLIETILNSYYAEEIYPISNWWPQAGEELLKERFQMSSTFIDYAWLVYIRDLFYCWVNKSPFIDEFWGNPLNIEKLQSSIIAESLKDESVLTYFNKKLIC